MPIKDVFKETTELKQQLENISVADLKREMDADPKLLLLDIREIQELVDLGTIPGATHCARGMLEFWASPASPYYRDYFQEDRRTVLFCAGGGRSVYAALALKEMGFKDVAHLDPGFTGWKKAAEPIEDVALTSRWVRRDKPSE
jgi:rhodanese-related sulfurtransferase